MPGMRSNKSRWGGHPFVLSWCVSLTLTDIHTPHRAALGAATDHPPFMRISCAVLRRGGSAARGVWRAFVGRAVVS